MARIFGSQLAELIAAAYRDHGVDRNVGRKVDQVNEGASRLDDGTLLDADLVVFGTVLDWPRLPASPSMVDEISPPACRTSLPPGHRSLA